MLWTAPRVTRRPPKRALRFLAVVTFLAINVGAMVHYRDRRPILASAGEASAGEATAGEATADQASADQASEDQIAAGIDLEGPPDAQEGLPGLRGTAGLRTPAALQRVEERQLGDGQTPAALLAAAGVRSDTTGNVIASLSTYVDFRRMRPGDLFTLRFDANDELHSVDVQRSVLDRARATRDPAGSGWLATKLEVPVEVVTAQISGTVESSLWDAVLRVGEDPRLVLQVVDIFAWEIDFYSEVHAGDTFRVLVEKRYADGRFLEYGKVAAAEFVSGGVAHRGFVYHGADGTGGYYDERGGSMRRQLLKSPLQYGHVTSRYGSRRHPVLGYTRQHNGVDYGVPTGTPTWAVGDGRVVTAGWQGGFGRLVEVRHANGWVSQYAHLSRVDVRVGQRVRQKQVVGRVGSSGLATGPHLHYGLRRDGRYVNPLVQNFRRGTSLGGAELARYLQRIADLAAELDSIRVARHPVEPAAAGGQASSQES